MPQIHISVTISIERKFILLHQWFLSVARNDNSIWDDDNRDLSLAYMYSCVHVDLFRFFLHAIKGNWYIPFSGESLSFSPFEEMSKFSIKCIPIGSLNNVNLYNPICTQIPKDTIVEIYKNEAYMYHVFLSTLKGYQTVLQACWYLDLIKYGVQWPAFYSCDPHDFFGKVQHVSFWYFSLFGLFGVWVIHQC